MKKTAGKSDPSPVVSPRKSLAPSASPKRRSPWHFGKHTSLVMLFSFGINMLGLVGAVYMMQVYDRVLMSGSVPTLIGLSIIAFILYLLYGCFDYIRTIYLSTSGESFADQHRDTAFRAALEGYSRHSHKSDYRLAIEDLATVRRFLTSKGYSAIFDVIWMPIFLIFIFNLHVMLGVTALSATLLLICLAIVNERSSRERIKCEGERDALSRRWISNIHRHAHLVRANGMDEFMADKWIKKEREGRIDALNFAALSSKFSISSKTIRMIIQSMILGLGGFLAIKGHISPGAMIAASIVFTRTLAPVERLLSNFAVMIRARQSWARMKSWIGHDFTDQNMSLPTPHKSLTAQIKMLAPPGGRQPVLQGVQFHLKAGDVLGIIGPSGSGKSSLAKALAGAWYVQNGIISMDGANYADWPTHQLGSAIGYMAQDCELFDGTIAENICGFKTDINQTEILRATAIAGAHDMILALPQGYNTAVGPSGISLSAGQRQRLNLARALFGDPFVVVLDEPNSNLDEAGETALLQAIKYLKANHKIVVIVAHRRKALQHATKLCLIQNGTLGLFGPAQAVVERIRDIEEQKAQKKNAQMKNTQMENARNPAPAPHRPSTPHERPPIAPGDVQANPYTQRLNHRAS